MKFIQQRIKFGAPPPEEVEGTDDDRAGLPTPAVIKSRALRLASIKEAAEILTAIPGPQESLHCITSARMDLTDVIEAMISRLGSIETMHVATLSFNARVFNQLLGWLDGGKVKRLTLLSSKFWQAYNKGLFEEMLAEFRERGQKAACDYSHCKVVTMAFASGAHYVIEGSANLAGNGSGREQFALFNSPELSEWHSSWIKALVAKHESNERGVRETS